LRSTTEQSSIPLDGGKKTEVPGLPRTKEKIKAMPMTEEEKTKGKEAADSAWGEKKGGDDSCHYREKKGKLLGRTGKARQSASLAGLTLNSGARKKEKEKSRPSALTKTRGREGTVLIAGKKRERGALVSKGEKGKPCFEA